MLLYYSIHSVYVNEYYPQQHTGRAVNLAPRLVLIVLY